VNAGWVDIQQPELPNAHNADRGVIGLSWDRVPSLTSSIGHEFYLQNAKHASAKNIQYAKEILQISNSPD